MKTCNKFQNFLLTGIFCLSALFPCILMAEENTATSDQPENRVVIMIDSSDSYKKRQMEAIDRILSLLQEFSQSKIRRWEKNQDKIIIISLDAMPEVIWQGNLTSLKAETSESWKTKFKSRNDYDQCSDVITAFNLAVKELGEDSPSLFKYLFIFSDLVHEPPRGSIRKPSKAIAPASFSASLPWESLKNVSVSVFWMPPEQKFLWAKTIKDHGLESRFSLYTGSDMTSIKIAPPARPQKVVSDQKQASIRGSLQDNVKIVGSIVLYGLLILVGIGFSILILAVILGLLFKLWRKLGKKKSSKKSKMGNQTRRKT